MRIKPAALTGLHVGSEWVRLARPGSDGKIRKCGSARLPEGISPGDRERYLAAVAEAISRAAIDANIAGGPVSIALGGPEVIVRRLSLPELPPEALARNVRFELAPFLALPQSDYAFGYKVFGHSAKSPGEALGVLAVAAPRELPSDIAACARAAGFKPKFADSAELARDKLFRFLSVRGSPELANSVVLDIGDSFAHISAYLAGRFAFNRYIPADGQFEDSRDRTAAELAAILDYAYYAGARGAACMLYVLGTGPAADPAYLQFMSDFLGIKTKPLSDAMRPLCRDEHTPYVDALAAAMREVG